MSYIFRHFPTGEGAPYYTAGTGVRLRRLTTSAPPTPDMSDAGIIRTVAASGERIGTATGRVLVATDRTARNWIEVTTGNGTAVVREDLATALRPAKKIATGDGRALLENLLLRSNKMARELLYQGEIIRRGKATPATKARYDALRQRHIALRRKLAADSRLRFDTKPIPGFEKLAASAGVSGIGLAPVLIWGAVALGTLAVVGITWLIVYQSYHTDATAAELDLKECQQLTALLESANPATKTAVVQEVQKQMDTSFQDGYTKGTTEADGGFFGGLKDLLKWGGLAYAVTKFL